MENSFGSRIFLTFAVHLFIAGCCGQLAVEAAAGYELGFPHMKHFDERWDWIPINRNNNHKLLA